MPPGPLHVVVPPPAAVPSGGNVYNARILASLAGRLPVELHFVSPDQPPPALALGTRALIDTLVMAEVAPQLAAVRQRGLLVHHLDLFDPAARDGERARRERELLGDYGFFVVTSAWSARALCELGVPAAHVHVVHPGLDADYLLPCAHPGRPARPVRLLTVANLIARKGLLELLSALHGLDAPDWTWTIAGSERIDPEYARRFRAALGAAGLAARVQLLEVAAPRAMAALYDDSDLLLSGARFETLGMAVREAMARALPVLAWDVGGIGESVVDGETGYLVRAGDDGAFRARLRSLMDDAGLRAQLGARARSKALGFPSWQQAGLRFAEACAAATASDRA